MDTVNLRNDVCKDIGKRLVAKFALASRTAQRVLRGFKADTPTVSSTVRGTEKPTTGICTTSDVSKHWLVADTNKKYHDIQQHSVLQCKQEQERQRFDQHCVK